MSAHPPTAIGSAPRDRARERASEWARRAVPWLLLAVFAVFAFRSAWITEDAYIGFRTIDNALHGDGLTWNLGERVQVYTHPLWTLALLPCHWVTGEYFLTAVAVSLLAAVAGAALLVGRVAPSRSAALVAVAVLACSKGYMDFSTSGLENPLSHLILIAFSLLYFRVAADPTPEGLGRLTLLACLGMLTRLDTSLVYAPALAYILWQVPKRAGLARMVWAFSPLFAWEAFSLVYYGFLFPNTAYAKLHLGMSDGELMRQGWHYFHNAWRADRYSVIVLLAGLCLPVVHRRKQDWPLVAGVCLYLFYVVRIGGDYMSMRFLTLPLAAAAVLLCRLPALGRPRHAVALTAALVALSLAGPRSPLVSDASFGTGAIEFEVDKYGIADERGFYYGGLGLLPTLRQYRAGLTPPTATIERQRISWRDRPREVKVNGCVGVSVFSDAAAVQVIDFCAIGDPLLARMTPFPDCRVGHYGRHVPDGYIETLKSGENRFADPRLGLYYEKLKLVISGPIWSRERWRAIWEFNTGALDGLIDQEHYRYTGGPPPAATRHASRADRNCPVTR
jgi:arabinofuranosyltransferase